MKSAQIRRPTAEKEFVLRSIKNGIRLDGRQPFDYRNVSIEYGVDYGCCEVSLGETRVLSQVSCEMVKPRQNRQNDGDLYINVELSPLASPEFDTGRMSERGIELNRLVERCLKESRPIDTESLCLIAGEKVWSIRVDVLALNDNGNLLDCSCIAAVASLANFKRPDVTVDGDDVIVHTFEEKEPIALNVHHMPICITFGFVGNGEHIILDPEEKEVSILNGEMTLACNILGEICCAQMGGGVSLKYDQMLKCANIASIKAGELTKIIKDALEADRVRRAPKKLPRRKGLQDPVMPAAPQLNPQTDLDTTETETTEADSTADGLPDDRIDAAAMEMEWNRRDEPAQPTNVVIQKRGPYTGSIGRGNGSAWDMDDEEEEEETTTYQPQLEYIPNIKKEVMDVDDVQAVIKQERPDSDEEEEYVIMDPMELGYKPSPIIRTNLPASDSAANAAASDGNTNYQENTLDDNNTENNNTTSTAANKKAKKKKKKKKKKDSKGGNENSLPAAVPDVQIKQEPDCS